MSSNKVKAAIPEGWVISDTLVIDNTVFDSSTYFKVEGEGHAIFRFVNHTKNGSGDEWVSCVGGKKNRPLAQRSFHPSKIIRTVKVAQRP